MTKEIRTHKDWTALPGRPAPFVLRSGEGEHSIVVDQIATVMLSGKETGGQFGLQIVEGPRGDVIPAHLHPDAHHTIWVLNGAVRVWADDRNGLSMATTLERDDFLFIPAGTLHTYQIVSGTARMAGINTGGFERFVHAMGVPTGQKDLPVGPIPPVAEDYQAAGVEFGIEFHPEWDPTGAQR
ncbi:quercetin 2,3-dioxygenase [Pseudofrankia sp. DC12]|uniref:quercetin 2,3-dioxygenase n=1 Tax=Pseudofrankia sp. DC12 TaxID=683315 RepID=UPI0005F7AD2B|nr:quercetin 2,3-dioxygenase [Pseudofrankia sp. DC12]